jgi:hypothetical protein
MAAKRISTPIWLPCSASKVHVLEQIRFSVETIEQSRERSGKWTNCWPNRRCSLSRDPEDYWLDNEW